jgi:hypothetical protein
LKRPTDKAKKEYLENICNEIIEFQRTERTLEIDEELCVCFIHWQKAFDRVNWAKLVQILKATGMDWREKDTCGCGPVV